MILLLHNVCCCCRCCHTFLHYRDGWFCFVYGSVFVIGTTLAFVDFSVNINHENLCWNDVKLTANKLLAYANKFLTTFGTSFIFKVTNLLNVFQIFCNFSLSTLCFSGVCFNQRFLCGFNCTCRIFWMYTKKVDKYDIIRIKKKTSRRNKKCQEKSAQNTQMNLNRQ